MTLPLVRPVIPVAFRWASTTRERLISTALVVVAGGRPRRRLR